MTTDELLMKLPSHIGRNEFHGFYISDNKRGGDIGWLYLHNDGKDWCASYGREGEFVCLNPDAEKPPYNNAVCYGSTPNEALQGLYDWCVKNGFINEYVMKQEDLIPKFGEYSDNEPLDVPTMTTEFVKEQGFPCPEGYIFKDENGNIINATKIVLEKKKKEYPKTYAECYQITGLLKTSDIYGYKNGLLFEFQKLLIALDAYWKIAGEEMGLGKPWEPDWKNSEEKRYSIVNIEGDINLPEKTLTKWILKVTNKILVFPTEEMRDTFYENFKKEIEVCKELL